MPLPAHVRHSYMAFIAYLRCLVMCTARHDASFIFWLLAFCCYAGLAYGTCVSALPNCPLLTTRTAFV
jgi:hypothetical protein